MSALKRTAVCVCVAVFLSVLSRYMPCSRYGNRRIHTKKEEEDEDEDEEEGDERTKMDGDGDST